MKRTVFILSAVFLIVLLGGCVNPETGKGSTESKSEQNSLEMIGGIDLARSIPSFGTDARQLVLIKNHAYMMFITTLVAVDISDPTNLSLAGKMEVEDDFFALADLATDGKELYYLSHKDGIKIVDIDDPANMKFQGSVESIDHDRTQVTTSDGYLVKEGYAKGHRTARIIDTSDPENRRTLGVVGEEEGFSVLAADVSGNYLYAGGWKWIAGTGQSHGLYIFDISDPASPQSVGSYDQESGTMIAEHGDMVVRFTSSIQDVLVSGSYAYVTERQAGIKVIDVSDPSAPKLVHKYETRLDGIELATDGRYLYAINANEYTHPYDLMVFPLSNSTPGS